MPLIEKIKELGRWIIRRDAEASGTRVAGWVDRLSTLFSTVIGVSQGINEGLKVFVFLWFIRGIAGYVDLNYLKISAYALDYLGIKAPATTRHHKGKK